MLIKPLTIYFKFELVLIHQALVHKLAALSGLATLLLHELVHLQQALLIFDLKTSHTCSCHM